MKYKITDGGRGRNPFATIFGGMEMLKGSLTDEKMELMKELVNRGSCQSLKYLCNGIVLEDFQSLMTAWILIIRTFICTLDTGLGKTVIASAVMKWLKNSGESMNFLYVAENGGIPQTAKKVTEYTGMRVRTCNATEEQAELLNLTTPDDYDILMISYQALQSFGVAKYLVSYRECFPTIIYDECQWLSELNNSNTWEITRQMRKYFRDVIMFSATPFKSSPMQMLKQVELLDPTILGNINAYIADKCTRSVMYEITDWHGLDQIREDLTLYVNGFTREELGIEIKYHPFAHIVKPLPEQCEIKAHEMTKIKSYRDADSLKELVNIVLDAITEMKQGIIYCSTNENKAMLKEVFDNLDVSCEIIDGTLSDKKKRSEVQKRYMDGEISILIINITTTLDLPSQYCVFYELCDAGTITQFIGRCIRGLGDTELDVHFILTDDTYEIDYFYNSIWKKSVYIQECLNKDDRLMKAIKKQVDKHR